MVVLPQQARRRRQSRPWPFAAHVVLFFLAVMILWECHDMIKVVQAFLVSVPRSPQPQEGWRMPHLFQSERVTTEQPQERHDEEKQDAAISMTEPKPHPRSSSTTTTSILVSSGGLLSSGAGEATLRLGGPLTTPTVWTEFSRIAQQVQEQSEGGTLANLGQGFPDWLPPKFAIDSLVAAALDSQTSPHQYTRPAGHPHLVEQLARRYSLHLHRTVDSMQEVAVTVGASQALYLSLQTLIQPGDEVILFEPFFDLYLNQVRLAGGTPVFVPLEFQPYDSDDAFSGGDWVLHKLALQEKVNTNTKAIILNSPHNPTGKIFTRDEMEMIAESLEWANPDCVVLSDEVYKYIVHAPPTERSPEESLFCRGHVHFASLPGMWERTLTISSAGKTFSATGWQIGWCIGPRHLVQRIHQLLPYVQFCAATVLQEALARSLTAADEPYQDDLDAVVYPSYYDYLRTKYARKRDLLAQALHAAGLAVPDYQRTPGGGFFILARIGPEMAARVPAHYLDAQQPQRPPDWVFCEWLAQEHGVLCIPSSPFFTPSQKAVSDQFVRIAFCKTDETIEQAAQALRAMAQQQQPEPADMEVVLANPTNSTLESMVER